MILSDLGIKGDLNYNVRLLVSKGGEFELDTSSWSTYQNFDQMYNYILDELVDAGIVDKLSTPVWVDERGKEVWIEDLCGYKISRDIEYPDYELNPWQSRWEYTSKGGWNCR